MTKDTKVALGIAGGLLLGAAFLWAYRRRGGFSNLTGSKLYYYYDVTPENPINVQKKVIEDDKKKSENSNFTNMPAGNYVFTPPDGQVSNRNIKGKPEPGEMLVC
jgi:hypothetical protein